MAEHSHKDTHHAEHYFQASHTVRDVVIGMADGLTVPFALAAGLTGARGVDMSRLIVVAGLAEIAAGSIAMGLGGWRFAVALGVNFALGALLTIGIGNYAPSVVLLSLLGLHPLAAFPIMMGTCGIVQPVAGLRFIKSGRFAWGPSLGLVLGGVVGVLLAVYVVKQLPLRALRWVVIVVVTYAAVSMLRSAAARRASQ